MQLLKKKQVKRQTMVRTHYTEKFEQRGRQLKIGTSSCGPEGQAIPAPLETPIVVYNNSYQLKKI